MMYDIRLWCLLRAYFGNDVPTSLKLKLSKIPQPNITVFQPGSVLRDIALAYKTAYSKMASREYGYFDSADKLFWEYRYKKWKNDEDEEGWKSVTNSKKKRCRKHV